VLAGAAAQPAALLALLQALLGGVAGAGAPTLLGSPGAFAALRALALLTGLRYQEAAGGACFHSPTVSTFAGSGLIHETLAAPGLGPSEHVLHE
jgi:hypothetical protein